MNIEKLSRLSAFLRNEVTDGEFNMGMWLVNGSGGKCGCAIGLAAASGIFEGVSVKPNPSLTSFYGVTLNGKVPEDDQYGGHFGMSGFLVAESIFDIDRRTSVMLFDAANYPQTHPSRHVVADRIDQYIVEERQKREDKHIDDLRESSLGLRAADMETEAESQEGSGSTQVLEECKEYESA